MITKTNQTAFPLHDQVRLPDWPHKESAALDLAENSAREDGEGWSITDDRGANWAVNKIKAAREEIVRLTALADGCIEEIRAQLAQALREPQAAQAYFSDKLRTYMGDVSDAAQETKTQRKYKLLAGCLVEKKATEKMVPDKAALLAWCEACAAEYVKTKKELDWAGLKKQVRMDGDRAIYLATGEILDAVAVEHVPATFSVEV